MFLETTEKGVHIILSYLMLKKFLQLVPKENMEFSKENCYVWVLKIW